ncbi:MAG TPA: hypothetical protein PLP65_05680 [Bacteroidales bacterium]|nr:hypothetical protein [Bacteroidales bacterium]
MKLNFLFIYFVFFTGLIKAQLLPYNYVGIEDIELEKTQYIDSNAHPSIKPFLITFSEWQKNDSTHACIQKNNLYAFFKPIIQTDIKQNFKHFTNFGVDGYLLAGKKISAQLSLSQLILNPDSNLKKTFDSIGLLSHYGRVNINSHTWQRTQIEGSVYWQALPYLSFQAGVGNHFLGDGYRSLFLSSNTSPYPFILGTAKIWKVEYLVLYSFLNEPAWKYFNQPYKRKNSTLHYLSWNINKRLNINAFEAVVWQVHDSIGNRGFDVNYINPIIFFRPIEFSIGSPDNVIMGMGFRYRIFKNTHIYSQLLLDEFKLSEIKAKNGWWGNKFGLQAGIKTYRLFGSDKWFALMECNTVRPFTYSHSDYLSNWGHMHQPLAHPLGANFIEWVAQSSYKLKKWTFAVQFIYQRQGQSNAQFNAGNNIYLSYNANRQEYGNYLLIGSNYEVKNIDFRIYYLLKKSWHLRAFAQIGLLNETTKNLASPSNFYFHFGLLQKIKE